MRGGLKVLSGKEVVDILAGFGFVAIGGTKHFKVRRTTPGGDETLVIPNHDPVAKGTVRAIFSLRPASGFEAPLLRRLIFKTRVSCD